MTVTFVEELAAARKGKNTKGIRTYTRAFLLTTSSQSEGPYAVGSHASLPVIGSAHDEDPAAYCNDISIDCTNPWKGWTATYNYTTEVGTFDPNPLFEPAVIEWDGENFEEPAPYDLNGDATLNSAGDPFEDLMRERSRRVVTIVKNIGNVPAWILDSEDAVNSAAFTLDGFPIATNKARLKAPRIGRWQNRNGIAYREMTMVITLNKNGWTSTPIDRGFRFKNGSGDRIRITNDDGTDISAPVCLDGTGLVLTNPTPSTAVYASFDLYPAYDFNLLPLT